MVRANDYLYFHRKKSNARRFFNYPHRRKEKRLPCAENVLKRNTIFMLLFFHGSNECMVDSQSHIQNSIVNWNIRNSVSRNRIEIENKLFSLFVFSLFHFSVRSYIYPNTCINMFILCPIVVVFDWEKKCERWIAGERVGLVQMYRKSAKTRRWKKMCLKCIRIHAE